jgi:hypothetical protein
MAKEYKTYSEKLTHPFWQKKRQDILTRDNYTCQECFDTETTLHIHHLVYHRATEPWEYPDSLLLTLCENCHSERHSKRDGIEKEIIQVLRLQLRDNFILSQFKDFISFLSEAEDFVLRINEIGPSNIYDYLVSESNKFRAECHPEVFGDTCPACGGKFKSIPKYSHLLCVVCGFNFYNGKNQNDKTETR